MKILLSTACAIVCLLLFSLSPVFAPVVCADDKPHSDKPAFVDLDGDGFNDSADDADGDGIPDEFEHKAAPKIIAVSEVGASFFAELNAEATIEQYLSAGQRFALRKDAARDITSCRSDLAAAFDDSGGFGSNVTSGGGHCVGGVCF